jgi:hypothetical protein
MRRPSAAAVAAAVHRAAELFRAFSEVHHEKKSEEAHILRWHKSSAKRSAVTVTKMPVPRLAHIGQVLGLADIAQFPVSLRRFSSVETAVSLYPRLRPIQTTRPMMETSSGLMPS